MSDWLTAEQRSRNMAAIRSKATQPESLLIQLLRDLFPRRRQVLHAELPGKPDVYLPGLKLAAFVDGCFWHGCPKHGRIPEDNSDYWGSKLARNKARDRRVTAELRQMGLVTVRLWEHDLKDPVVARRKVRRAVKARFPESP